MMRIGILPLGRPTFDVDFANEKLGALLGQLDASAHQILGPRALLFDEPETRAAFAELQNTKIDHLLILQVTFTDAAMTAAAGAAFDVPMSIWAVPEPRIGGRLRLNAFCGLNLAAHALGLNRRSFTWGYGDVIDFAAILNVDPLEPLVAQDLPSVSARGSEIVAKLKDRRVARVGEHPVGFDTCKYDKVALKALAGVEVDELSLEDLFERARAAPDAAAAKLRSEVGEMVLGTDAVDAQELDKSLRLKLGLDALRTEGGYDAFALRCWPETFTEYGGAVCGPAAMLGEARVPCACEADVYGALTQLLLSAATDAPVFLTDLVDMDSDDNTGVVWHCGQAPLSMRDEKVDATATIHTNRKMPLLFEFPLKPGRVTLVRVSQALGNTTMILAGAEVLRRPMAFTGTSGVLRFDRHVDEVLPDLIASGLEHHMALAYGDHRDVLRETAGAMGLKVLEL